MKFSFNHNSQSFLTDMTPVGGSYRAVIGDKAVEVKIARAENGILDLLINGKHITVYVSSDNAKRWVTVNGQTFVLTQSSGTRKGGHGPRQAAGEMVAPMPGQVRVVNVGEGEAVTKGQTLLVLEAMKMEIRIHAPRDGRVKKLFVNQGQTVEREQILVEIEDEERAKM